MFRRCPECRGEFQEWVERCPDCQVALVAADQPLPPKAAPPELPEARELVCVERGEPRHLRELAFELQAEGVPCRIDLYPPPGSEASAEPGPTRFGLYVERERAETAAALRTAYLERVVPDSAGLAENVGSELVACPACGESLAESAVRCDVCELEFPPLEE